MDRQAVWDEPRGRLRTAVSSASSAPSPAPFHSDGLALVKVDARWTHSTRLSALSQQDRSRWTEVDCGQRRLGELCGQGRASAGLV